MSTQCRSEVRIVFNLFYFLLISLQYLVITDTHVGILLPFDDMKYIDPLVYHLIAYIIFWMSIVEFVMSSSYLESSSNLQFPEIYLSSANETRFMSNSSASLSRDLKQFVNFGIWLLAGRNLTIRWRQCEPLYYDLAT